jgi:hypothetical protein
MADGVCDSYCKGCVFNQNCSGDFVTLCVYYLVTNVRRPCPAGQGCTVKQTGRKLNKWGYENNVKWKEADNYRKQLRAEHLEQIRKERHMKNLRTATCAECGKEFYTDNPRRIYCSDRCKCRVESRKRYRRQQEARKEMKNES